MTSPLVSAFADRIADALRRITMPITYQTIETFSPRVATTVAIGAGTMTLNNLPTGMDRIRAGDTFSSVGGTGTRTFTAEVLAAGGTITDAPFGPVTTAQITAGSTVSIQRLTNYAGEGWMRGYGADQLVGGIQQGDFEVHLVARGFPVRPRTGMRVFTRFNTTGTIQAVMYDEALSVWRLQVRGG